VSQRVTLADTVSSKAKQQLLMTLATLIEEGTVTPVIDRQYPFGDMAEAVSYSERGHVPGKVVVTV
jgi:NADPH:quinone reductase-like Zn-dependent oxidoreductase